MERNNSYSTSIWFISTIYVKPGQRVKKGQNILRISRIDNLGEYRDYLVKSRLTGRVISIPVYRYQEIKGGDLVAIVGSGNSKLRLTGYISDQDDLTFFNKQQEIIAKDSEDREYIGRIEELSSIPDPKTGLLKIEVSFNDKDNSNMREGAFVIASFKTSQLKAIFIPQDDIVRKISFDYVWVVNKETGTIHLTKIETGFLFSNDREIKSGLQDNDMYLSGGKLWALQEGMIVPKKQLEEKLKEHEKMLEEMKKMEKKMKKNSKKSPIRTRSHR